MVVRFSSNSSRGLLAFVALANACAVFSCRVDERDLSITIAGATSDGGVGSGSTSGAAGSGSPTQDSAGSSGNGATSGSPGTSGSGAAGSATVGGAGLGGGASGAASNASGATAGSNFAGGVGGQPQCSDIDQDRVDDCSETLALNARFDVDVEYWPEEALATHVWDPRNARAGTGSGSILISNSAPVASAPGSFMVGAHQCLQVTAGVSYEVAARVLIPSGQGAGEAGINVQVFGADDCAGSFLKAETVASTSDVDTWSVVAGEIGIPPTARSMWLRLVASKPFTQATLHALFDDVLVRQK